MNNYFIIKNIRVFFCVWFDKFFTHESRGHHLKRRGIYLLFFSSRLPSVVTFIFVTSVVQHLLISKILFHSNAISAGCSITVTFALEISFSLLNATAHSPHRLWTPRRSFGVEVGVQVVEVGRPGSAATRAMLVWAVLDDHSFIYVFFLSFSCFCTRRRLQGVRRENFFLGWKR